MEQLGTSIALGEVVGGGVTIHPQGLLRKGQILGKHLPGQNLSGNGPTDHYFQ